MIYVITQPTGIEYVRPIADLTDIPNYFELIQLKYLKPLNPNYFKSRNPNYSFGLPLTVLAGFLKYAFYEHETCS